MNAVITGGTKGIGRAIINLFVAKGIQVSTCSRHQEDLDQLEKELLDKYPQARIHTFLADVSVKEHVLAYTKDMANHLTHVDIIVNNAGVYIPGDIHSEPNGTLEKMIDTNLYSAYHLTRALLPGMIRKEAGYIFNICSVASLKAYPGGGSYTISKFALLGFSKCLREELKDKNIKVTAVMPGATWSDSWSGVDLPESRLMQANDVALAIWNTLEMSPAAVVEEIIMRPQLGDL